MTSKQKHTSEVKEIKTSSSSRLADQAHLIDAVLSPRFMELKTGTLAIIDQIHQQKSKLLQRFDMWLMPMAKDVINQLLNDAEQLKSNLDQMEDPSQTIVSDWVEHAKTLSQLYHKWHNQTALTDQVLDLVAGRASAWIDKDIQVIQDYQNQSIAHLVNESQEFADIQERLSQATAEPLKQLLLLRQQPKNHRSLKQASEWLVGFQAQRESCFDQVLMKIDAVVHELVQAEDFHESGSFAEWEGEVVFMEREFQHLHNTLNQSSHHKQEKFIQMGLENLLEHVDQLVETLPKTLQARLMHLKKLITIDLAIFN